jgi:hypothetical protein
MKLLWIYAASTSTNILILQPRRNFETRVSQKAEYWLAENNQNMRYLDWDLNRGLPEYETGYNHLTATYVFTFS